MEERYEIRGKIGQGGLGTVYRGYDTKMKREVAIKRISQANPASLPKDAHEQLLREASTLSSLQHPNIVTVYDYGTDEQGPYVIMELIPGRTLNEIIDRAPLTWHDFRELALQTQEALIAAQELNLVHGDLKPANIILDWLPSGKFQVKILDFGQAVFAKAHSQETVENLETIFGTIHFMAPEQFARAPLDIRSDMYSLGCVYYQALTSRFPFNGRMAEEITGAHIRHAVIDVHEFRKDVPRWACDWVMWHINREPADRPQSARKALARFLNQEQAFNTEPATTKKEIQVPEVIPPEAKTQPKAIGTEPAKPAIEVEEEPAPKPKAGTTKADYYVNKQLVLPKRRDSAAGSAQEAIPANQKSTEDGDSAIAMPTPSPDRTTDQRVETSDPAQKESSGVKVEARGIKFSSPQPLLPPAGSKPSIHPTSSAPAQPAPNGPSPPQPPPTVALTAVPAQLAINRSHTVAITTAHMAVPQKKGISSAVKVMVATALIILIAVFTWILIDRMESNKQAERLQALVDDAARTSAEELPVNREDLDLLLQSATSIGFSKHRASIYKALLLARPIDGTNVDEVITDFVISREMLPEVKEILIRDVLRMRQNPSIIPTLLNFASTTPDTRSAANSLQAIRFLADDDHFEPVLAIILGTSDASVRKAAEDTASVIISKSKEKKRLGDILAIEYANAITNEVRNTMLRLLGACGGEKALLTVRGIFASSDVQQAVAALSALGGWGDDGGFPVLLEFIESSKDPNMRARAFDAAYRYLMDHEGSEASMNQWLSLSALTRTREEQIKLLQSIANLEGEWALNTVRTYLKSDDERVAQKAAGALDYMLERQKLNE